MRRVALTLVGFSLAAAFYLLLVDTVSLPELYVLVAVALLAAIAFEAAREQGFPEARFSLRSLRRSWRAGVRVPSTPACCAARRSLSSLSTSAPAASSARFRSGRARARTIAAAMR